MKMRERVAGGEDCGTGAIFEEIKSEDLQN